MFVLALIPLSLILRKAKAAYEFSESKEKINHLLFMDDLTLYSRSEKGLDSLVQTVRVFNGGNGLVVKALDSQSRGLMLKTTEWLQG